MAFFRFYKALDLAKIAADIGKQWDKEDAFSHSLAQRKDAPPAIFYEGPPGANGKPGIHHLFIRTFKDLLCRYKTMAGYYVSRKAGWDTHGLPVELAVEKELGITKEDIGHKIPIAVYNEKCKKAVMRYEKEWKLMTKRIGFWLDMEDPYRTCDSGYISTLWGILELLYKKEALYKGYSIQPYSPAAGTSLSNHELNQPGCYREITSTSIVAQFSILGEADTYFLAWTTTPWTLPANSALAVGKEITYIKIATFNPYTKKPIKVILAEEAVDRFFTRAKEGAPLVLPKEAKRTFDMPWQTIEHYQGADLVGYRYAQLMPYITPKGDAFRVVAGDFVTTTEGSGIVHIAPTFGADDAALAKAAGIPAITVPRPAGPVPIVDKQGRFVAEVTDFPGHYIKPGYDPSGKTTKSLDVAIAIKLKQENKAFHVARYSHSYPHCWRTDKPVIYYPQEGWFIKTTAFKERLIAINKEINWHPRATGEGRFGQWLAHLVDWNITRDRFWGTPIPIWRTKDGSEERCIGSLADLREAVELAVKAGVMTSPLPSDPDLHLPAIDNIVLLSRSGKPMYREKGVVDVWFDSGGMPYAQHGLPIDQDRPPVDFPASFIIEGIDQTRGWFFTLHVLAVMLYDMPAFKHVLATGLVLDKEGRKMSKRLGNSIEPTQVLDAYGPDVLRWYMVTNGHPWDNLKFDPKSLDEVKKRFFATLFHTYQFFALYANIDAFKGGDLPAPQEGHWTDRWILSKLQGVISEVSAGYEDFAPTLGIRLLQEFVINDLSNWYVRLNRKRFWQGGFDRDKAVAYRTLYHCLTTIARLAAPVAPFYMDRLYRDLQGSAEADGVHLTDFPKPSHDHIDRPLEAAMHYAQQVSSLAHSLRKAHRIKVRQPLTKLLLPIDSRLPSDYRRALGELIAAEVNVKEVVWIDTKLQVVEKRIKPNFPRLGEQYGPQIKAIAKALAALSQAEISAWEEKGSYNIKLPSKEITLALDDVVITTSAIPGWATAQHEGVIVALDLTLTPALLREGLAREVVNRLQHLRKEKQFDVSDKVTITMAAAPDALSADLDAHRSYIMEEVQAIRWEWTPLTALAQPTPITLPQGILYTTLTKASG